MFLKIAIPSVAVFLKLSPQTIFLEKWRKYRCRYGFGEKEIPVSKKVEQRFREVMDDLKLSEKDRERIKIFSIHDVNLFHAGTINTNYGAIIGIPPTFDYTNAVYINRENIALQNEIVDKWDDKTLNQFIESLVFSENAQKFAMAREILKVTSFDLLIKSAFLFFNFIVAVTYYDLMYVLIKLDNKPKLAKFIFMGAIVSIGIIVWILIENLIDYNTDTAITESLIKLGPEYIQGGHEFYEKLLNKTEILRKILPNFKKLYTEKGETSLGVKRMVAPAEQKEYFSSKLKEIQAV